MQVISFESKETKTLTLFQTLKMNLDDLRPNKSFLKHFNCRQI